MDSVTKLIRWLSRLVGKGLLTDFITSYLGLRLVVAAMITALLTWLGSQSALPAYFIILMAVLVFFIVIVLVDTILAWRGSVRGIRIKFCDADGMFTKSIPYAYFGEQNKSIVYQVDGYARLANLGLRTRTVESVYIELRAKNEIIDQKLLSQFPIGKRIESLDTTPNPITISTKLIADEYKLNQLIGHDHSKAKVVLIFQATGALYRVKTKVKFKNARKLRHE